MEDWRDWKISKPQDFWGDVAPCEHVLQIYDNDDAFLNTLAGFVGDGINSNDCSIVIATGAHLKSLESLLAAHGVNVGPLIREDLYIPIDAEEALSVFMINDRPDPELFFNMVSELVQRGHLKDRNIRAFGEMVALLWEQGNNIATVRLEHLWNRFCKREQITLLCAYPKRGFTDNAGHSLHRICAAHSKVISGQHTGESGVHYKDTSLLVI